MGKSTILATFFKSTSEDWHPSWQVKTAVQTNHYPVAEVRYYDMSPRMLATNSEFYRICVSGADDTRMEFDTPNRKKADEVLAEILRVDVLTYAELKALGFLFQ